MSRIHYRTLEDIPELESKRVFLRADLNVPIREGIIGDDSRIQAVVPTIKYLTEKGAKVVLASHLGRPKGEIVDNLVMAPIGEHLSDLLGQSVHVANTCIGDDLKDFIADQESGEIVLLENLRFYPEEETNDSDFAQELADLADLYVNDAFGTAHRAHASTEGIAHYLDAYAGLLMTKELEYLGDVISQPKRPFVAIIGGSKISTKFVVLKQLIGKVDTLIIGGGMAYTLLKAQGLEIGNSLVESDLLEDASSFLTDIKSSSTDLVLPLDHVIVPEFKENSPSEVVPVNGIKPETIAVDVGQETVKAIQEIVSKASTVLWNGPLGVFEMDAFSRGTIAVANSLADSDAISIVGGGDSVAAIHKAGVADKMSHVSTGGGASLEFLEGKVLPGLAVLMMEGEVV